MYTVDLLDYAQTDTMLVKPLQSGKPVNEKEGGNVFVAKTVTDDGSYGGNIMFFGGCIAVAKVKKSRHAK